MKHVQTFIENNKDKKILIFSETKAEVKEFEKATYAHFLTLHGDLEQGARETRLQKYKDKGSNYILVATDVAARGLDIDDIDVVIQLGCRHQDSFVHRSGRTGRIGKAGLNILFFEPEEFNFVISLEKDLNVTINMVPHLVDIDPALIHSKLLTSFKHKVSKLKNHYEDKEAFDTIYNHIL